jgi:membrane-associated PAP2 superfamily phosphatase
VGLLLLLAWDASGLDLWLASLSASSAGFAARDHWFLTRVLHDGARLLAGLLLVVMVIATLRPFGLWRVLSLRARLWMLIGVAGGMLLPVLIKRLSDTSCPWDLAAFGGGLAWVSHWQWASSDGGPGHCFPAGHASAGFAWLAGYFAWPQCSAVARRWLTGALIAGLTLGVAQQLRGAHFMSHTLWTSWICWTWLWCLSAMRPAEAS